MDKRGRMLTSMFRWQFEEMRQGILDGSLADKWRELEDKQPEGLTRKQQVELRRLSWLVNLFESNPAALDDIVRDKNWTHLKVFDRGDGFAETVTYGK